MRKIISFEVRRRYEFATKTSFYRRLQETVNRTSSKLRKLDVSKTTKCKFRNPKMCKNAAQCICIV